MKHEETNKYGFKTPRIDDWNPNDIELDNSVYLIQQVFFFQRADRSLT